jgi:hypothetical protein
VLYYQEGGLFQLTILSQSLKMFILILGSFSRFCVEQFNILLFTSTFQDSVLAAAGIIYLNAETDKKTILLENKGRAGIYQWTHKESGKIYIGSAHDLLKRLNNYYTLSHLNQVDNCQSVIISRA